MKPTVSTIPLVSLAVRKPADSSYPGRTFAKLLWFFVLLPVLRAAPVSCATCHKAQSAVTPMTRALEAVKECEVLRNNPKLVFEDHGYRYTILRVGEASIYSVTDGKRTITIPLGWAFGLGKAGQTYVFEREGNLYESRVSFFKERSGLDLTMGAQNREAANLEEAAGRLMSPFEARECFACHTTDAVRQSKLQLHTLTPGVQCIRCHTGGETHAAAALQGGQALAKIEKLSRLSTEEMSTFCGQCHRTWADIAANGPQGVANVRFQPYRLANSKCYDATDPRIRCTSCHDPHQTISAAPASYDGKCVSCHAKAATKPAGKSCPVALKDCTSCHMPKYELPGAHYKFTDHQIRVVRAKESYPN